MLMLSLSERLPSNRYLENGSMAIIWALSITLITPFALKITDVCHEMAPHQEAFCYCEVDHSITAVWLYSLSLALVAIVPIAILTIVFFNQERLVAANDSYHHNLSPRCLGRYLFVNIYCLLNLLCIDLFYYYFYSITNVFVWLFFSHHVIEFLGNYAASLHLSGNYHFNGVAG